VTQGDKEIKNDKSFKKLVHENFDTMSFLTCKKKLQAFYRKRN
jgi:hypothetical protein